MFESQVNSYRQIHLRTHSKYVFKSSSHVPCHFYFIFNKCLNNFKATAKASQPLTVLCVEVYLIDTLSSALLASHCFVTLCFVFSKYVAQFWKFLASKKGFSIDWDYFCSSQGTFNTQGWIQWKAFSVQRMQTVQDHFIPYWISSHLSPSTGMGQGAHWRLTNSKNKEKHWGLTKKGAKGMVMKSNYKYILELSRLFFCFAFFFLLKLLYVHYYNFLFLLHDLTGYLATFRQLIVKYSCPSENVIVTVLLTWIGHGNIFVIITQPVLYLILSCWN